MKIKSLYRGKVTRVGEAGVYIEVPHIATGSEFGPCEINTSAIITVGDRVVAGLIEDTEEDFVVLSKVGPTPDAGGLIEHEHPFDEVTGVIADTQLPERVREYARVISDWNTATTDGYYRCFPGAVNAPTADFYLGIVAAHTDAWVTQRIWLFTDSTVNDSKCYERRKMDGVWTAWRRVRYLEAELDARYSNVTHTHDKIVPLTADAFAESALPAVYPLGVSMFATSVVGWPVQFGTVSTTMDNINRGFQLYIGKDSGRAFTRTAVGAAWSAWRELSVVGHGHSLTDASITGILPDAQLPSRLRTLALTTTDWNTAIETGWYKGTGAANAPDAQWWMGQVVAHSATYVIQEVAPFTQSDFRDGNPFYTSRKRRVQVNGTWGPWITIRDSEAELDSRYGRDLIRVGAVNILSGYETERLSTRFFSFATQGIFAGKPDGTPVVLSFDLKATIARGIRVYPYQNSGLSIADDTTIQATTSYKRYTFATTVKNWGAQAGLSLGDIAFYDSAGTQNYWIRNIQVEFANVPSEYRSGELDSVIHRVVHGATASTARPDVRFVEWVGSVAPTNATSNDTWVDTSA